MDPDPAPPSRHACRLLCVRDRADQSDRPYLGFCLARRPRGATYPAECRSGVARIPAAHPRPDRGCGDQDHEAGTLLAGADPRLTPTTTATGRANMRLKIMLASLLVTAAFPAAAADMVFTSWGGTTQDAQTAAWAKPFATETGTNILQDGPTDYGKIKAMVESGNVSWDVVDVEGDYAAQAGK